MRRLTVGLTTLVLLGANVGFAAAQDYRSADARDAARALIAQQSDLRSPDARDASRHPVTTYTPGRIVAPTVTQPVLVAPAQGFDWGDAAIGAAGMLALVALVAGTLLLTSQNRRERRRPVATS